MLWGREAHAVPGWPYNSYRTYIYCTRRSSIHSQDKAYHPFKQIAPSAAFLTNVTPPLTGDTPPTGSFKGGNHDRKGQSESGIYPDRIARRHRYHRYSCRHSFPCLRAGARKGPPDYLRLQPEADPPGGHDVHTGL